MEKRIKDWEPARAGWTIHAGKLRVVAKPTPAASDRPALVRPALVRPSLAGKDEFTPEEANPLDDMTWEERFWFAFQAILELERDLEELEVREEFFRCNTCRRESGLL